jgi:hypothetical protein
VGFRRNGAVLAVNPTLLVDTGADGTLLSLGLAKPLGFEAADLVEEECSTANGLTTLYKPKLADLIEIQIGSSWFALPSLKFGARAPVSLLGRDLIFAHFELRMTSAEFELLPISKKKNTGPKA